MAIVQVQVEAQAPPAGVMLLAVQTALKVSSFSVTDIVNVLSAVRVSIDVSVWCQMQAGMSLSAGEFSRSSVALLALMAPIPSEPAVPTEIVPAAMSYVTGRSVPTTAATPMSQPSTAPGWMLVTVKHQVPGVTAYSVGPAPPPAPPAPVSQLPPSAQLELLLQPAAPNPTVSSAPTKRNFVFVIIVVLPLMVRFLLRP